MNLKQIFNLKKGDVLGLDIGSCSVKIIAISKDDAGYKIKAAGMTDIVTGHENEFNQTADDNTVMNSYTVNAIRECFASAKLRAKTKLRTSFAVCGLSGPEVAVRDFAFPPLAPEDIEGAVSLEAAQVCPFNADQASVDYQLISEGGDKTRGILVAATNILVTNKVQLAKEAGLKCVLMDIDGLALLNCFHGLVDDREKSASAILNVGGTYTTLAVMSSGGWPFIRDTAYAGNDILRQIAEIQNISHEELKQALFVDPSNSKIELGNSLETACEELIAGVSETLRFYAAQEKSETIRKIYVCGGFASATGFIKLLNHRLGAEAILWNPFDNVPCEASQGCKDLLKKSGYSFAVAAGLAMRTI